MLLENKTIIGAGEHSHYLNHADILILLRNRTHAIDYERALREAHIPYLGTERGTLLDSLEIKDMVNLLQWLITPFDNHALAGVLRSPLFSASNEEDSAEWAADWLHATTKIARFALGERFGW